MCANSALLATAFIACGEANRAGNGDEAGGNGGHAASVSSGGGAAAAGSMNHGGTPSTASGGSTMPTGGSNTAAGGLSAGQTQISSGGRSPTGGVGGNGAGAVASGGKLAGGTGGAGGTSSGGSSAGGAGGEGTAGAAGLGGAGGASECALIKCTATCAENWLGLDGCPTCACAPPAATLLVRDLSCPSASLTMTAASSYFIGGINRWLIDFDWACSDFGKLGEPSRGHLQVGIIQPLSPPVAATNRTFFYPRPAQSNLEYELRTATVWQRGSGVPEIEVPLTPSSSFLSIRIEKGMLVGGVAFSGSDSTSTATATMAGPFSVAVPTAN